MVLTSFDFLFIDMDQKSSAPRIQWFSKLVTSQFAGRGGQVLFVLPPSCAFCTGLDAPHCAQFFAVFVSFYPNKETGEVNHSSTNPFPRGY